MTDDQEHQMAGEIERGGRADRLLNDALFKEAFTQVEAAIVEAWKNAPIRDVEGQQMLRMRLKALQDARKYIEDMAQTGRLASIQLERERTLRERATSAVRAFRR